MVPRLQLRHCLAAEWVITNPVLKLGEVGVETDTGQAKVGDGITPWNSLPYIGAGSIGQDGLDGIDGRPGATGAAGTGDIDGGEAESVFGGTENIDGGTSAPF